MTRRFFVGVSGFSYPKWKGTFYPKDLKSEEFLSYYSRNLGSVEINSSFYAVPKAAMVEGWSEKTKKDFVFSFKAPQQVTHILKLGKGADEAANRFSKVLDGLGSRRGPVLFQLPPYSKANLELLRDFLSKTAAIEKRVFEFRNDSWFQEPVYDVLEKNDAAFCIAETEDLAPTFKVTGGIAYFRLRLDSYDEGRIDDWAKKVRETADGVSDCYVYLRHDETGKNALLAQRLSKELDR